MKHEETPRAGQTHPQYCRPKQAAEHLQIAVSTLWVWAKTRGEPFRPIKAGPRVTLFNLDAIEAYLREVPTRA